MRRAPELMARSKFRATPLFVEDRLILWPRSTKGWHSTLARALNNGDSMQRSAQPSGPPTVTIAAALPIGWTAKHRLARCADRVSSWAQPTCASSRRDASSGTPCNDFASGGEVKLDSGMPLEWPGEMQITSAPVIARDILVVGSAIADNRRVRAPRGTVRALGARTGRARLGLGPASERGHRGRSRQRLGANVGL
jgi:quinoprotein glucose dehydrogenase